MNELIKWLKENIGDNVEIVTPLFERTKPLEYKWKPQTKTQFYSVIREAPWNVLKGMGFGKWDTMNNLIKEAQGKKPVEIISIPIINPEQSPMSEFKVDIGVGNCPTKLLEVDEDVLLFPKEWYDVIPDGFMVTGLWGETYPFKKGESDDDIRFGCLAYGFRKPILS